MKQKEPAILITGGAGFIGSNFITYFMDKYPGTQVVNMDKLTYAGDLSNLDSVRYLENYHFIQGDITNQNLVKAIFSELDITGVIYFAAESHVDRSIEAASQFAAFNMVGTMTLLQAALDDWSEKNKLAERRFHHISTDEVYGSLGSTGKFREDTPYDPRNPYSASKAGSDMLVKSFGHTYG